MIVENAQGNKVVHCYRQRCRNSGNPCFFKVKQNAHGVKVSIVFDFRAGGCLMRCMFNTALQI